MPAFIAAALPPGARSSFHAAGSERMHVHEWGPPDGPAVLLVHGNPTWSFLWRKVVAQVRARPGGDRLRLIAPDLIGLGLSSKPPGSAHSLDQHVAWLGEVVDRIVPARRSESGALHHGPGSLVLVAQDWGGPIGLGVMTTRRERLRALILGNTSVSPPAGSFKPTLFHRLSQLPLASDLLFRWLGFPLRHLHLSQGERSSIRGDVARAYWWPLAKRADRGAPLALARMVPDRATGHPSLPMLARTHELFATVDVPIHLVWGTRDPILGRVVNHLERTRPDAKITRTSAGHFLQEEVPDALADAILAVS